MLIAMLAISGCATIPAQEMSDARQALRAAEEVGAATRATRNFDEAKLLVEDANRFLNEGRYELARIVALRAKRLAIEARQASVKEPVPAQP